MILNPVPGSTRDRNDGGYSADSGLDILTAVNTPVVAAADGVLEYSEQGHTPWMEDTNLGAPGFQPPHSILLRLDQPFQVGAFPVRYAWYTHLTRVANLVPDGGDRRVRAGETIGWSGIGNNVPHLHFGLLSNRAQANGQFLSDRQVADLVWPGKDKPAPPAPVIDRAAHRAKQFLNDNRSRGFLDGAEVNQLDVLVQQKPGGLMQVRINGELVKARGVTVDIAFD